MTKRIAVLGAGPSGLAQLRAFDAARKAGIKNLPEVVCFEKQSDLGGMWNYTWRTGLDQYGEPIHASMYRYLWSNGPKECLEFADYSFEEHFGRAIPSYPPRAVLRDYIMGRVEKGDLRRFIRFNTAVRWVAFDEASQTFTVTVMDQLSDTLQEETFDHVIVATGHFSTPNMPYFNGIEQFNGRVLHAHDFRDAREFSGQDLLIVGSSYSAEDIGTQCYKYGARSVTLSYRSRPMGYHWPKGIEEVPLLVRLHEKTAYFSDGSQRDIDAVILCTGYLHHYPFLPDELRLQSHNCLYPDNLYKGVVWQNNPKLFFLGMQDQYFTFNMFDAQAWYLRELILGRQTIPNESTRKQDIKAWLGRADALEDAEDEIDFQAAYVRDLLGLSDYPDFPVEAQADLLKQWQNHKRSDIMGYRNYSYVSTQTGTLAPGLPAPWLDILDDSLESFLSHDFEQHEVTRRVRPSLRKDRPSAH